MKKRKILSVVLLAAMVGSVFLTGCGEPAPSESGTAGTDNHGSVSLPKEIDGKTIKVIGYDGWEQEHGEIRQKLKDWYNATVEYTVVDSAELENKLSLDLVANITYDFMPVGQSTMLRDLCIPITKYVDQNDPIFASTKAIMNTFILDGELYAMSSIPHMEIVIYNKTLLENLGYETPLELYNRGEWTFDSMKKLVVDLSKEKTPEGEDLVPLSAWDYTGFLVANGTDLVTNSGVKDFKLNFEDTRVRESLNFLREIAYVNKGFEFWQGWSQANFQLGTTAMVIDRFGNKTHFVSDLYFDWDFVPWPAGPSADENIAPGTIGTFGVPKGSKNPSGGAAYGYLFMKQDFEKRREYLQGYLTDEQVERFESLYPKISTTWSTNCGIQKIDELFWEIGKGTDVTKVLEQFKPKWQSDIDTYKASLKR